MNSLKVLKLLNGDEVIGFIEDGNNRISPEDEVSLSHMVFIKGPMRIISKYDETVKSHALYLVDWMPTASSNVLPLPKNHIVTMDTPNASVEEHYLSIMGEKFPEEELTEEEQRQLELYEQLINHQFDDEDEPQ